MKIVKLTNKQILAEFLLAMYTELFDDASEDIQLYIGMAEKYLREDDVYTDEGYNGFFILHDSTIPVLPGKRWEGIAVYIKPDKRHTNLLNSFYAYIFTNYEGDILGFVEPTSEHLKVLTKRHLLVGHIYKLNRR